MSSHVIIAGVFGATIGSFLNVVAYRLPRGESLAHPGSHCTACGAPVRPYDNVPVLSWLLLRGRCRDCRERISPRYPLVEAVSALLFAAVLLVHGPGTTAWLGLAFVTLLVPVALIDLDHRVIPNRLVGPAAIAAVAILAISAPDRLPDHLIAGAGAGGALLLAALAYPGGMGMGDVKLAGVMGLYLGVAVIPAILIGVLAGAVVGAAIMARKGIAAGRKTAVPFGPFLALGGVVGILAGSELVHAYTRHFL